MKKIFTLAMLLPLFACAQKVALIDRNLKKPITYVSSMDMKYVEQGYFVMSDDNINDVIKKIEEYRGMINDGKSFPSAMSSVIVGKTYFTAGGNKRKHSLVIDSKIDKMGTYYTLASKDKSKEENLSSIDRFLAYLKNNVG